MILALSLLSPLFLLALMLVMERVEMPLRAESLGDQIGDFLESARPEEVETFISDGLRPALDRYWSRRRFARLLPGRTTPR